MGKKNKGHNKSGFDKNTDTVNYDEEMGRKTIGNLINGLDDDASEPTPEKPVVRAVRLNAQKANREKITTDFYDEDRAVNNSDDIVTGFKEVEETSEESVENAEIAEDLSQDEEDPADTVRIRRPNILKDDSDNELDSREKYRRQFLEGYTDHERKRLELDPKVAYESKRKTVTEPSSEQSLKRLSEEERALPPKRRPAEGVRRSRESSPDSEQRPRRRGAPEEEATLITKRNERKERTPIGATATTQPSYGAPIFKILAVLFLILLVIIVVLAINLNSANQQITYLEEAIEQFDEDVEELGTLRSTNVALRNHNEQLIDDNNRYVSQIEDLKRELQVQGVDSSAVPSAPGDGAAAPGTTTPDGMREHVVQSGQTLYSISIIYFGHGRGANAIMQASGLDNSNIRVGDRLNIPANY